MEKISVSYCCFHFFNKICPSVKLYHPISPCWVAVYQSADGNYGASLYIWQNLPLIYHIQTYDTTNSIYFCFIHNHKISITCINIFIQGNNGHFIWFRYVSLVSGSLQHGNMGSVTSHLLKITMFTPSKPHTWFITYILNKWGTPEILSSFASQYSVWMMLLISHSWHVTQNRVTKMYTFGGSYHIYILVFLAPLLIFAPCMEIILIVNHYLPVFTFKYNSWSHKYYWYFDLYLGLEI